ncbi:phage portal protein [Novosphingobium sp. BW1]|uniref:phage portal protein n=1 Tax=Novosphingobium sp. BW1 TaxID=2592621 RepID=UPI0011DEF92F|nr:phage portal protein [Novosphingobium sp. BW1]TYC93039.1 phage portal protein [Novosphingobium sp. BW1]
MGFWSSVIHGLTAPEPAIALGDTPKVSAAASEGTFFDLSDPRVLEFLREGSPTAAGKYVTERSAMQNPTFNRAVTVISQTLGMLPLNLMVKDGAGKVSKAADHPVHKLLKPRGRPNGFQDPFKFKTYMQGRALIKGNAYALKVPGVRGIGALIPLDPDRVVADLDDAWNLTYKWTTRQGRIRVLRPDEVVHLRSPWTCDGLTGDGLIKLMGEALGLAEAADEAASRLIKNGSYVGGALKHPKQISNEAAQRLRDQFAERHSGPENAGRWIVTEEGMDVQPFGMTSKDAQGLESRRYQAEEVSRGTGVPRPLLMFDETSWGSGIEQLGLFFITYCLAGWFTAWEEALAQSLLSDAERETHFFKFNEAALLRGSLKDQSDFLKAAIGGPGQGGYMVPNEAREVMDLNKSDDPAMNRPAWATPETANAPS